MHWLIDRLFHQVLIEESFVVIIFRGHYVGIHTSNFHDLMLKPELLRAVVDCGFEHPSEG
jgi:hypothetical protein